MNQKLYGVFVSENDKEEKLVWFTQERTKLGRKFFWGGSGIFPCVHTNAQSAHAYIKREKLLDDFDEGSQAYVRHVMLVPYG